MYYRCIFLLLKSFMIKMASVLDKSGPGWVDLVVAYLSSFIKYRRLHMNVVFIKSEQS